MSFPCATIFRARFLCRIFSIIQLLAGNSPEIFQEKYGTLSFWLIVCTFAAGLASRFGIVLLGEVFAGCATFTTDDFSVKLFIFLKITIHLIAIFVYSFLGL